MPRIGVQLIYGANPEPFLEAALRSVEWADYVCAVNTDPGQWTAALNEETVRLTVPSGKLRHIAIDHLPFDFALARNVAFALADLGDYVLIVDSDDVHFPEMEAEARSLVDRGHDIVTFHYWHLAVTKDLLHSLRYREILFQKTADTRFDKQVHEHLSHPRQRPTLGVTRYVHYGYIKPAREVAARWELYRTLGSAVHDYDRSQPDRALDEWPKICTPFQGEHPPAVRELLESYPTFEEWKCRA